MKNCPYQELFDYMINEHGVILLQSELQDIVSIVERIDTTDFGFEVSDDLKDKQQKPLEECPKCKSRFGLIIYENLKQKKVLCLNGDCDFEDEEIDDYIRQEFLAKKSGMTDEQILNGEHFDIEFND